MYYNEISYGTFDSSNWVNLISTESPFFGRIRTKTLVIVGHERSNFSSKTLPIKPVAPVTKTVRPA